MKSAKDMTVPELLNEFMRRFPTFKQGSFNVDDMRKMIDGELIPVFVSRNKFTLMTKEKHDELKKQGRLGTTTRRVK